MLDFITHYYYENRKTLTNDGRERTISYCEKLANIIDPIRNGYWNFIINQIKTME